MVDDLVFEGGDDGEGAAVLVGTGEADRVPGVTADLGGLGELGEGGVDGGVDVGGGEGGGDGGGHGAGAVHAVAVLGVAGVELGEVGRRAGVAGVHDGEDAGADAGGVVEVVRVVVAGGGRAQAGGEVAEAGADGDPGAEGEDGGLDLGRAFRCRGDLGGEGVPRQVDGGAHAAGPGEVAEQHTGGGEHGLGDEGGPFGVVGGAEAEGFGGLVEGDGDGEGGGGVLLGEGVELAGQTAGPLGHPAGAVPGGGPPGRVACGESEEEALDGPGPCGELGGTLRGPEPDPGRGRLPGPDHDPRPRPRRRAHELPPGRGQAYGPPLARGHDPGSRSYRGRTRGRTHGPPLQRCRTRTRGRIRRGQRQRQVVRGEGHRAASHSGVRRSAMSRTW